MNIHRVWQTTYRLDLFGCVALKDILFDLNEFRICELCHYFLSWRKFNLKIGVWLRWDDLFPTKAAQKRKQWNTDSNGKFSPFFFLFLSVLGCFLALDQNKLKSIIMNCFYLYKNPLGWKRKKKDQVVLSTFSSTANIFRIWDTILWLCSINHLGFSRQFNLIIYSH